MIRTCNRVALYARFSSDNQRSESIDAQVRAMEAYCQQHRYVIVKTYVDEAKSATSDRRPAFQEMIHDSSNGNFNIVLVHKLDRFARNRYDSAIYKRELKKNGVAVYSVLENLDDSPESIIMESVLEGMGEYYSQNLAREVMKGMRETALQCKHTGGKPPLGYDVDPESHKLVVNPREAEIVRLVFGMYSRGMGYSPILEELHNRGWVTKNGKSFQKNSLYSILTNQKYKGTYIFNRSSAKSMMGTRNTHLSKNEDEIIVIDGGCPQIVDTETFEKVQARIQGNVHKGGRGNAKTSYLLSGKIFCKECGRAMVGNARISGRNKQRYITYRCPSKRYNCSNKEINRDYLESYVIELVEKHILNKKVLYDITKRISKETQRKERKDKAKEIEQELAEVEAALRNVADAVAAGLLSDALIERLSDLESCKAELEKQRVEYALPTNSAEVDPAVILKEYYEVRQAPASKEYRDFLQEFVGKITVGRYAVEVQLRTGLSIAPMLDKTVSVRRQQIYEEKAVG